MRVEGMPDENLENSDYLARALLKSVQLDRYSRPSPTTFQPLATPGNMAPPMARPSLGAAGNQPAPGQYAQTPVVGEFYFTYVLQGGFVDVPVGATNTGQIRITADHDFVAYQINATSTRAFTYQIQYQGADRTFSDGFQHSDNATGTGERPFFLPVPVFLRHNSNLLITFTDQGTAPAPSNRIFFEMIGSKVLMTNV